MYDIIKENISFEWDYNKDKTNINKHGVSFKEASSVFLDDNAILYDDPIHSEDEERFNIIGYSNKTRICIVSHCVRENNVIRIISARKATRKERNYYYYEKQKNRRRIL